MQNGQPQHEATQAVQTLAEVAATHQEVPQVLHTGNMSIQVNADEANQQGVATLAEATINSEGQLVLTGDASAFSGTNFTDELQYVRKNKDPTSDGAFKLKCCKYVCTVCKLSHLLFS